MSKTWSWIVACLALVLAVPFILTVAGDAQVHLAIAERFASGEPFRFNPDGEIVVASTSPFWTLTIVLFNGLAGPYAPWLLKLQSTAIWLATVVILVALARKWWRLREGWLWAVLLLWLLHTTIVANALGGLENGLSALQLLLITYLVLATADNLDWTRSLLLGLMLGWAILTRPDGGLFALLIFAQYAVFLLLRGRPLAWVAGRVALAGMVTVLLLIPWYGYQLSQAGSLLTDSSIARLYNGRQGSLTLIAGLLYLHPKAIISLATAFGPLTLGACLSLAPVWKAARAPETGRQWTTFAHMVALVVLASGALFYTFIVGAEAFGRYFLPIFPFLFLSGLYGLRWGAEWLRSRHRSLSVAGLVLLALFMVATSAADLARRLGPGRFTVSEALDVIYGPAQLQYLSLNVPGLPGVQHQRSQTTDQLLGRLGVPIDREISIAVTEVQLRYFVDQRVEVLSLDGRTSAEILAYVDPRSGVPDFGRYFEEAQPDFVHAAQWCTVGGWLANLFRSQIVVNLVCDWQRQSETMAIGESFLWKGRAVRLVAPQILEIDWHGGAQDSISQ